MKKWLMAAGMALAMATGAVADHTKGYRPVMAMFGEVGGVVEECPPVVYMLQKGEWLCASYEITSFPLFQREWNRATATYGYDGLEAWRANPLQTFKVYTRAYKDFSRGISLVVMFWTEPQSRDAAITVYLGP